MNNVSFYGSETNGSVSDKIQAYRNLNSKSAKNETTGSVGYLNETQSADTVCFRGHEEKKGSSFLGTIFKVGALALITIGGLAAAHKYNAVEKIPNDRIKGWLKNSGKVTEPCYNWCKTAKEFCTENYNKLINRFKK